MTTRAQARAELITALRAASVRAYDSPSGDPPYVLVGGGGIDMGHISRGQALATIRARCVAGAWTDKDAQALLDELVQDTLAVLLALTGWRMLPVGQDEIRRFEGGDYLTADVSAARMIDI
jgi:hypothetical protein